MWSSALPSLGQVGAWGVVGKQGVKSSWTLSSMWTIPLQGQMFLEGSRDHRCLQLVSSYGRQNLSLSAALNTLDKVRWRRSPWFCLGLTLGKCDAILSIRVKKTLYIQASVLTLLDPGLTDSLMLCCCVAVLLSLLSPVDWLLVVLRTWKRAKWWWRWSSGSPRALPQRWSLKERWRNWRRTRECTRKLLFCGSGMHLGICEL